MWREIGFVEGKGTTTEAQHYRYEVPELEAGGYAFRLKQVDYDGQFEYGSEVEVIVEAPRELLLEGSWPNPVRDRARIRFTVPSEGEARLVVYDVLGREVSVLFEESVQAGRYYEAHFEGGSLASGTYLYVLEHGGRRMARPLVLAK